MPPGHRDLHAGSNDGRKRHPYLQHGTHAGQAEGNADADADEMFDPVVRMSLQTATAAAKARQHDDVLSLVDDSYAVQSKSTCAVRAFAVAAEKRGTLRSLQRPRASCISATRAIEMNCAPLPVFNTRDTLALRATAVLHGAKARLLNGPNDKG